MLSVAMHSGYYVKKYRSDLVLMKSADYEMFYHPIINALLEQV